jgi:hypothetical protein
MTPFEQVVAAELIALLRAGVPVRAVRLTVRELVVTRIERGPVGAREVGDAVDAAVRAVCHLARERDAPVDVVETVCMAALEAVRGHGGETARWLGAATSTIAETLDELAREHAEEPGWRWLARRVRYW